jgi:hypothetical protein
MGRIYVRNSNISTIALQGDSLGLVEGLNKYKKEGRFREQACFGNIIFGAEDSSLSVVGEIYFPEFCTLSVYHYPKLAENNTVIYCHGTSKSLTKEFLEDFATTIQVRTIEPTQGIIDSANQAHLSLESLWKSAVAGEKDPILAFANLLQARKFFSRGV